MHAGLNLRASARSWPEERSSCAAPSRFAFGPWPSAAITASQVGAPRAKWQQRRVRFVLCPLPFDPAASFLVHKLNFPGEILIYDVKTLVARSGKISPTDRVSKRERRIGKRNLWGVNQYSSIMWLLRESVPVRLLCPSARWWKFELHLLQCDDGCLRDFDVGHQGRILKTAGVA